MIVRLLFLSFPATCEARTDFRSRRSFLPLLSPRRSRKPAKLVTYEEVVRPISLCPLCWQGGMLERRRGDQREQSLFVDAIALGDEISVDPHSTGATRSALTPSSTCVCRRRRVEWESASSIRRRLSAVANPFSFCRVITANAAMTTLCVAFASSVYSGALQDLVVYFYSHQGETATQIGSSAHVEVLTLGISLFVLGFALGPLFWAPFS